MYLRLKDYKKKKDAVTDFQVYIKYYINDRTLEKSNLYLKEEK